MLNWLINKAKKTPYFHLEGYMNRWWLVPYAYEGSQTEIGCGIVSWYKRPIARILQKLGIAIRIHEILRSDEDRDPHDHPWWYVSLVLKGEYYEYRYTTSRKVISVKRRGTGSVVFRKATSLHYLQLPKEGAACTTLFITGRKSNSWGFLTRKGKVGYRDYLGL